MDFVAWPEAKSYSCQTIAEAAQEAKKFLLDNMPPWDAVNQGTLELGILEPTVNISLAARKDFSWTSAVPKDVWLNYVLPYANVNEGRSNWRQLFSDVLKPIVTNSSATSLADVALLVNKVMWSALRPQGSVVFKSEQTPLIYDPMSTLVYGYASCTGISILYVDALRSVGVPARLVGTPAWNGKEANGNHNWVEVYLGEGLAGTAWSFIEGAPAGGGETFTNPCDKWYCNPAHFDGQTKVFAAQWDRQSNSTSYPMSWDLSNENVPGVNQTDYYNTLCQPCGAVKI